MSRPIPESELGLILGVMGRFPDGAGIEEIESALALDLPRRTLQRRLAGLVADGRLRMVGQRRGARYFSGGATVSSVATDALLDTGIPLSPEGRAVALAVMRPLSARQPVGYNRAFLDDYRPNVSRYLPESLCAELRGLGQGATDEMPAGTYARQILSRLLIDLSWNSSRLEGNTYSLLETERLLSMGEAASGKDALEAQMILNHKRAIKFLVEPAAEIGCNRYTLLNLHALLADNLLADPTAGGRLRGIAVGVAGTVFHPLEGPQRIAECFQQMLDTTAAIADPFEQAFFMMVHLPYLQTFEDVNKRVSRLAANIPLIRHNLCPLSFVDVDQQTYIHAVLGIYELNRIELLRDVFVWAYRRSSARYSAVRQSLGEPDPFRLRYRQLLAETVAHVVRSGMDKAQAVAYIRARSNEVDTPDRARFVEVAETEAMSLHEGNIARYHLRPSEYAAWRVVWK
ncbi:MAG: Fic family protein [Pseudomonadota bacterium]|nr:Fic family protein [Pseudomonadota bacterium]MDP1906475.1 Fic family protein [Pseudomonadota bacterium]MDP2352994.1 Fic family protein [Pseudomonadota bacterium]